MSATSPSLLFRKYVLKEQFQVFSKAQRTLSGASPLPLCVDHFGAFPEDDCSPGKEGVRYGSGLNCFLTVFCAVGLSRQKNYWRIMRD